MDGTIPWRIVALLAFPIAAGACLASDPTVASAAPAGFGWLHRMYSKPPSVRDCASLRRLVLSRRPRLERQAALLRGIHVYPSVAKNWCLKMLEQGRAGELGKYPVDFLLGRLSPKECLDVFTRFFPQVHDEARCRFLPTVRDDEVRLKYVIRTVEESPSRLTLSLVVKEASVKRSKGCLLASLSRVMQRQLSRRVAESLMDALKAVGTDAALERQVEFIEDQRQDASVRGDRLEELAAEGGLALRQRLFPLRADFSTYCTFRGGDVGFQETISDGALHVEASIEHRLLGSFTRHDGHALPWWRPRWSLVAGEHLSDVAARAAAVGIAVLARTVTDAAIQRNCNTSE
jgi:hypothetical protein